MAGIKELAAKIKLDPDFAKSLAQVRSTDELMETIRDAGFEVTLDAVKDLIAEKGILPEGILDKLPDSVDLGGLVDKALESGALQDGLKKLGKFF